MPNWPAPRAAHALRQRRAGLLLAKYPGLLELRAARTAQTADGPPAILGVWANAARRGCSSSDTETGVASPLAVRFREITMGMSDSEKLHFSRQRRNRPRHRGLDS